MRVVGYVRVSTDEQASEGVSLAAQREKLRLYAELHGLDLVVVEEDAGVSAKSLDRPALGRALDRLKPGDCAGLLIAKLDRLSRNLLDWQVLITDHFGPEAGSQLFSVADSINTQTAAGRLVLNILMGVAQWERETIVERTRDAVRHKRSKGERLGTIPYGSRLAPDGRTLERDPIGLATLMVMQSLRAEGRSLSAVAAALNSAGYRNRSGSPWRSGNVHQLLTRYPPDGSRIRSPRPQAAPEVGGPSHADRPR